MSAPLLYGPDNRPLDRRTEQQKEFDRRLRHQMGDNGGQFFDRRFIEGVKREFDRRPDFEYRPAGESFGDLFRE